jgi:hypothetical protein
MVALIVFANPLAATILNAVSIRFRQLPMDSRPPVFRFALRAASSTLNRTQQETAMAQCEKLEKCPFFNDQLSGMQSVANLMKDQFCFGDKSRCARYLVSTAGLPVPADLFPAEYERAVAICEKRSKK